ncbi:MAG: helix-turn-helix domain-containing protein [Polyangiaceae bacterium]|nr:helix-turn-helix domain-containing protein [Polyangiaceae bacterium]
MRCSGTERYIREAKALGSRVRALRHERAWTLEQMAERCDLDLKHLQKIEGGQLNVTLVTLVRLAVGLKKPLAILFNDGVKANRDAE